MKTGSFSRLATQCQICPDRDKCDDKRMEACAYLIPEPVVIKPEIAINITPSEFFQINEKASRGMLEAMDCAFGRRCK